MYEALGLRQDPHHVEGIDEHKTIPNMKNTIICSIAVLSAALLAACTETTRIWPEEGESKAYVEVSSEKVIFDADGGNAVIAVATNADGWDYAAEGDWFTVARAGRQRPAGRDPDQCRGRNPDRQTHGQRREERGDRFAGGRARTACRTKRQPERRRHRQLLHRPDRRRLQIRRIDQGQRRR